MSGREIFDTISDDWDDHPLSGEHFRGTVATAIMSDEEARRLRAHFAAAGNPSIISRTINRIANALGFRSERIPPAVMAAPIAAAELKPGDKMPDGTIYAGISPDTHEPMYTRPSDAPLTYTF